MIQGLSPVSQAFVGTLFTWGLTGAGAALVFIFSSQQPKILDGSLGFAAGVMIAASYWSLLKPAIEIATETETYGAEGEFVFLPVGLGFFLGALFVFLADMYLPCSEKFVPKISTVPDIQLRLKQNGVSVCHSKDDENNQIRLSAAVVNSQSANVLRQRHRGSATVDEEAFIESSDICQVRWKRILLLIIAITVHNIPEGLAVGVGFGAVNKTKSATFESARNLALGIGIQNFPEGLAVSLPLHAAGMSKWKSFWYGQLSGLVEPLAGLFGCFAVTLAEPLLPYALAFAAGAMVYVVVDDIIPEAQVNGNGKLASWLTIVGFVVMMTLDVGLG